MTENYYLNGDIPSGDRDGSDDHEFHEVVGYCADTVPPTTTTYFTRNLGEIKGCADGSNCIKQTQDPRIRAYISKGEKIRQGNRNSDLRNLGLCLRNKFGLTCDALEATLQEVNQAKCIPPLSDGEVKQIARNVDKSRVPLGDATGQFKETRMVAREKRIEYYASVAEEPISVSEILRKEVSTYENCCAKMPHDTYTIGGMLESFRTEETIKVLIDAIRAETDRDKRSKLKQSLPAVVFGSEPQASRNNDACTANGVLCVDFDNILPDEWGSAKAKIAAVPYVFSVGLSASGNGFFALIAYEGTPDLKTLLAAMQDDFCYVIDKSRSGGRQKLDRGISYNIWH